MSREELLQEIADLRRQNAEPEKRETLRAKEQLESLLETSLDRHFGG